MSADSPVVISSDSEETSLESPSPVKLVKSSKYRKLFRDLDSSDQVCRKKLKFEEESCESVESKDSSSLHPLAYARPLPKYSAESILKLLLDPQIGHNRVCGVWPVAVESSAMFIIDVTKLKNPDDVRKDFFGKWNHSGSHPLLFKAYVSEDDVEVERCAPGASGDNVYYLRRLHSNHPSNSNFRRIIAFISDASYNPHSLCLVAYYIPPGFIPTIQSHGNAKSSKPFFPTLPSTMDRIRMQCSARGPKEVVASVSAEAGGIVSAVYPGELPRNEQQISQYKKRAPSASTSVAVNKGDELYSVMLQAQLEDNKYARDIKTFPEPAIVLANDRQLNDIARFCCDPFESSILTVDPTFCLGAFDVTPIAYRHLLLESNRTGKPPVIIGPTLIHYKKSFQSYLFFASSLIGLKKDLSNVHTFGTDGEKALIDAFSHEFRLAQHITCFNHVWRNVKDKLSKCSVAEGVQSQIIGDIFGKKVGSTLVEGLVDSDESSFEENVDLLVNKWKTDEESSGMDEFCEWFLKNKVTVIKTSMLCSLREEAGLGSPPEAFYTNASECVNNVIKIKVDYKSSELPHFISKLRELCTEQEREIERAIISRGKYRLRPQYRQFEVSESKWFSMSQEQRVKHLRKVAEISVSNVNCPGAIAFGSGIAPSHSSDSNEFNPASLSQELIPIASHVNLPVAAIEGIAKKAVEILNTTDGVVPAPGHDGNAFMVLSKSGKMPHLVSVKKTGGIACDKECPQYQSANLCSHVVAAAKHCGQFGNFISFCKKTSRKPNFTKLITTDMPKGRGKKGCRASDKRKASLPVESRCSFSPTLGYSVSGQTPVSQVYSPSVNFNPTVDLSSSMFMPSSSSYYPSYPPFYSFSSEANDQHPFRLHFVVGNISVCHGCKGHYKKELGPPHDLCIQHEEWKTYCVTGFPSPQSKFGNVYYHANVSCIQAVWPSFIPASLLIPLDIKSELVQLHKEWLQSQFGLEM